MPNAGFWCSDNIGSNSYCNEICGDGKNMGRNYCDDGNVIPRDGCSHTCGAEPGWMCTGGGSSSPDTCFEICGDSYDFWTKPCEDGVLNAGGCDNNCNLNHGYECDGGDPTHKDACFDKCGDGYRLNVATTVVSGSTCDDGNTVGGDGCSSICVVEDDCTCSGGGLWGKDVCTEICGDGLNMGLLPCDDKNTVAGDGCDNLC